jgi:CTP:molybdopterin cytidylyltransferase MocA
MPEPGRRFGGIILAAGASSRMGQLKQLLPIDGQPLVARAAQAALDAGIWPVVVVLGAQAARIRPVLARLTVLPVECAAWNEGMAASIRTGIEALEQFSRDLDGALLALCDQPAFSAESVARLFAAQAKTGRGIAAARYAGRQGAPALFRRAYFPALAALTGEAGARSLLNDSPDLVAAVDLPELAVDLDTPADFGAFQEQHLPQPPGG